MGDPSMLEPGYHLLGYKLSGWDLARLPWDVRQDLLTHREPTVAELLRDDTRVRTDGQGSYTRAWLASSVRQVVEAQGGRIVAGPAVRMTVVVDPYELRIEIAFNADGWTPDGSPVLAIGSTE